MVQKTAFSQSKTEFILALTTVDTIENAREISRELVQKRLAACVNLVPAIESVYIWKEKICTDAEQLLIIKSTGSHIEPLKHALQKMHPYAVPELIFLPIVEGLPPYLQWLAEITGKRHE